ncbi:hypothetical protein Lal_00041230 [Lupinus albus]|nr:hypothetical protein Lal_00041230 [Lupinus albus]
MGSGIAQVCAAAGLDVFLNDRDPARLSNGIDTIEKGYARLVSKGTLDENDSHAARERIKAVGSFADLAPCDLVIEAATENEATKRDIFTNLCPVLSPRRWWRRTPRPSRSRARGLDRPAGALHRHPLHESGAGHAARGADPGHCHRGSDLRIGQGLHCQARQDGDDVGGFPGLHRQPHPAADDQRGDLHALRRRGFGRIDRHRDEARRQPPDGAAATGGFHRPRYLPLRDAGVV